MLPLKSTKRKFIMATVAVLVTLGAYIYIYSGISSSNKSLSKLDYELSQEVHTESQLKTINDILNETTSERDILDSYFISQDGVVDFINNLESTARSIGVSPDITSVEIENIEIPWASNWFEVLSLNIIVEGSWRNVFHFLTLVDSLPYYISISNFSLEDISGQDEPSGSSLWTATFSIDVVKKK